MSMWGSLSSIADGLKNTIENLESDLDQAVGGNAVKASPEEHDEPHTVKDSGCSLPGKLPFNSADDEVHTTADTLSFPVKAVAENAGEASTPLQATNQEEKSQEHFPSPSSHLVNDNQRIFDADPGMPHSATAEILTKIPKIGAHEKKDVEDLITNFQRVGKELRPSLPFVVRAVKCDDLLPVDSMAAISQDHSTKSPREKPSDAPTKTVKKVHLIRHGQGRHNVAQAEWQSAGNPGMPFFTSTDPEGAFADAELTELGEAQARALQPRAAALFSGASPPELMVVSPMRRATLTGLLAFEAQVEAGQLPVVAHEAAHEMAGKHTCDRRLPVRELRALYPAVDYSLVEHEEEDPFWGDGSEREAHASVARRAAELMAFVKGRPETHVVVAAHSALLAALTNGVLVMEPSSTNSSVNGGGGGGGGCGGGSEEEGDGSEWFGTGEMRSFVLTFVDRVPEASSSPPPTSLRVDAPTPPDQSVAGPTSEPPPSPPTPPSPSPAAAVNLQGLGVEAAVAAVWSALEEHAKRHGRESLEQLLAGGKAASPPSPSSVVTARGFKGVLEKVGVQGVKPGVVKAVFRQVGSGSKSTEMNVLAFLDMLFARVGEDGQGSGSGGAGGGGDGAGDEDSGGGGGGGAPAPASPSTTEPEDSTERQDDKEEDAVPSLPTEIGSPPPPPPSPEKAVEKPVEEEAKPPPSASAPPEESPAESSSNVTTAEAAPVSQASLPPSEDSAASKVIAEPATAHPAASSGQPAAVPDEEEGQEELVEKEQQQEQQQQQQEVLESEGGRAEEAREQAREFVASVPLLPFGVLGQQLTASKAMVEHAPSPARVPGCVFVDPAGLHHIQPPGGPSGAGGAAGAIYKAIGIDQDEAFPADVVASVTKTGDAKYHCYRRDGESGGGGGTVDVHVIHAVGPDLRQDFDPQNAPGVPFTRGQAVAALAETYKNILSEFVGSGQKVLRLLPMSGGVFSGPFAPEMAAVTFHALEAGGALLDSRSRSHLLALCEDSRGGDSGGDSGGGGVGMCVFAEKELEAFRAAGFKLNYTPPPPSPLPARATALVADVGTADDAPAAAVVVAAAAAAALDDTSTSTSSSMEAPPTTSPSSAADPGVASAAAVEAAVASALAEAAEKAAAATQAAVDAAVERATKAEALKWEALVAEAKEAGLAQAEAVRAQAAAQAEAHLEAAAFVEKEAEAQVQELKGLVAQREEQVAQRAEALAKAHAALEDKDAQLKAAADARAKEKASLSEQRKASEDKASLLAKEVAALKAAAEDGGDKDAKIAGLTMEGQKLAKKQGELQKLIRDKNGKIDELEKEKGRAGKEREGLEATVAKLTGELAAHQSKVGDTSKSLQAMQAVSQASSDKLSNVEGELRASKEAEADLRLALDKAWAAEKEQKRSLHSLTAENESLKAQLGDGEAARQAVEEVQRELSVREKLLQATQRQLEDRLTRTEHEASLREDALRGEVADMRRRWQDATQRSDGIAAEVHESTAPLLRQIRALQEEGRARAQAWAQAEASFLDRAANAEEAARVAEQARAGAEERAAQAGSEGRAAEEALREAKSQLAVAQAEGRATAARQNASEDRAVEAEAEAEALREQSQRVGRELKAAQAKHRLLLDEQKEAADAARAEWERERAELEAQAAGAAAELDDARRRLLGSASSSSPFPPSTPVRDSSSSSLPATPRSSSRKARGKGCGGEDGSSGGEGGDAALSSSSSAEHDVFGGLPPGPQPGTMAGGGMMAGSGSGGFVVQLEKLHLSLKQREAECAAAKQRCSQVEAVCDALTTEVQELGRRHSELEEAAAEAPKLKKLNAKLKQKNNVLLELLGEKTEELEEVQQRLGGGAASSTQKLESPSKENN